MKTENNNEYDPINYEEFVEMDYKKTEIENISEPYCNKCKTFIYGNGKSNPYFCFCGKWVFYPMVGKYKIEKI